MAEQTTANNNFKEGLKGTTLFGGVQVIKIFIAVIRSKILAIFLGPAGVGILGLLSSGTEFVYSLSSLGLGTSAVKDISAANKEGDIHRLSYVSAVFKKLVWITGLLGTAICLFFAPVLSQFSFGNHDYTFTFMILSIILLFRMLSEGQNSLLQGTHNLRLMAKSEVWGNAFGLLATAPLYYFLGIRGIAPALILTYLINLLVSWFYSRIVKLEKIKVTYKQALIDGRLMIKLGGFLALSGLIASLVPYIIQVFISAKGSLDDVGLYAAGFAIVNTYVGMVFTAMSKEYFPRLSSFAKDNEAFNLAINQQMEIAILLVAPLICAFIIFSRVGILILYTEEFLSIEQMIYFAILAIFFKTPSWCCSYAIIAKGDGHVFFITETLVLIVKVVLYMAFYIMMGLPGIGIAFILEYVYYLLQEWLVCKNRYGFSISKEVIRTYLPHFVFCVCCLLTVMFLGQIPRYIVGSILIILAGYYSFKKLDKQVDIRVFFKSKIHK